jgi:hypothetical protein
LWHQSQITRLRGTGVIVALRDHVPNKNKVATVTDIGLNGDAAADRAELCGMLADQDGLYCCN